MQDITTFKDSVYKFKEPIKCFMTVFRNFKNQSAFYNHHASQISIKQLRYFLGPQCNILNNKKKHGCIIMDKKRLKIGLSVLDAVRNRFPETNKFIDSTLTEECEKKRITVNEVTNLLQVWITVDEVINLLQV